MQTQPPTEKPAQDQTQMRAQSNPAQAERARAAMQNRLQPAAHMQVPGPQTQPVMQTPPRVETQQMQTQPPTEKPAQDQTQMRAQSNPAQAEQAQAAMQNRLQPAAQMQAQAERAQTQTQAERAQTQTQAERARAQTQTQSTTQTPAPRAGSVRAWLLAARPKTLPASLAPVLVGTSVAIAEGGARPLVALACLAVALLLQLAANFVNDYADFERGSDSAQRLGPPRAAQQGLLSVAELKRGAAATLALAALCGLPLIWLGGMPILIGGALALLGAVAYTAGPRPLAYHGLGDPAVFVFFGLVATAGTHYVQAGRLSGAALASGVCMGFLATTLLAVNNLRDMEGDAAAGKRTLAVHLGERGARRYTAALPAAAYVMTAALAKLGLGLLAALPLLSLPLAAPLWRDVFGANGTSLNRTLAGVARLELVFGALLAAAFVLSRWAS